MSSAKSLKPKWLWHGDDGWHDYDAKLSDKIEKAYQADEDECKVDDERFVDLKEFLQRYPPETNLRN